MAIANPQWIKVADARHTRDVPVYCTFHARPFIYWKTTDGVSGTWFGRGSAGVEVTTGITDRNDVAGALQAAALSALV